MPSGGRLIVSVEVVESRRIEIEDGILATIFASDGLTPDLAAAIRDYATGVGLTSEVSLQTRRTVIVISGS